MDTLPKLPKEVLEKLPNSALCILSERAAATSGDGVVFGEDFFYNEMVFIELLRRFKAQEEKIKAIEGFKTRFAQTTESDFTDACQDWLEQEWKSDGDYFTIKIPLFPIADDLGELFKELVSRLQKSLIDRMLQAEALDIIRMAANSAKI